VLQLLNGLMDHGMGLEAAFHQPRIDISGNQRLLVADRQLPAEVQQALAAEFKLSLVRRQLHPYAFACPSAVLREGGFNSGCTEVMSPWGDAVAERGPA
jgi:gamma-glutamyltranspeptidase/glutathione hydrolase